MLRDVLREAHETGLARDTDLYITLRTDYPGVELPEATLAAYPQEITLALRTESVAGLKVDDEAFAMTTQFDGVPSPIRIPFAATTRFADTRAKFALELGPVEPRENTTEPPDDEPKAGGGKVVAFERPRK